MDFTIGKLKEILNEIPDNAIICGIDYRDKLMEFDYLKRVLLLEKDGIVYLVFNSMGTHFFDLVEKEGYSVLKHWDEKVHNEK